MNEAITLSKITVVFSWLIASYTLFLFKKLPKKLKIFGLWLIVSPLLIIYPEYLASNGQHNLFWRHVMNHFDFLCLTFFYFFLFFNSPKIKVFILSCFALYIGFSIFSTLTFESWAIYPATMAFVGNCIIVCYSMLFYYKLYIEERIHHLEKDGFFLINTGFFLYYMSTLFIYLTLNTLTFNTSLEVYIFFDNIDCSIYIFSKLLYAIGLWLSVFRNDSSSHSKK